MRLLVIEDDPSLRDVLVRGLESDGYFVDTAAAAENALELLRFTDYAVLIVDWRLPGMSGLDLVKHIRSKGVHTAVLMLTARDAPADRISGLDAGADDYLIKPFDFGELLARVRALQRRPGNRDGHALRRGQLVLDPATRQVRRGRPPAASQWHRVPHPGTAHAASARRGRPPVDSAARLEG